MLGRSRGGRRSWGPSSLLLLDVEERERERPWVRTRTREVPHFLSLSTSSDGPLFGVLLPGVPEVMGGDQWPLGALDPRPTSLCVGASLGRISCLNKSPKGNTSLQSFQISALAGVTTTEYFLRPISDMFSLADTCTGGTGIQAFPLLCCQTETRDPSHLLS